MKNKKNKKLIIWLFILAVISLLLLTFRYGNDYYWHLKAGEYMVENHMILKTDIFSWYLPSFHPVWISHEWLFEVLLYGGNILFGKYAAVLFTFIFISILFFTLYYTNRKGFHKNIYFTILWLIAGAVMAMNTLPRPFLISNIFLAVTLYLLYDLKRHENSKKIYFLPLISMLWANFHGGSSNLSYILIFVFYFCGLFDFDFGKVSSRMAHKVQSKRYLIVLFLTVFAICINPHGIHMLLYPYQNMNDAFMLETIGEWQPTNFNNSASLMYIFLLVVTFIPLIKGRKKINLVDLIVLLMFMFLGFKNIRFWPLAYIAFTYVVFTYVSPKDNTKKILDYTLVVSAIVIISSSCFLFKLPQENLLDEEFIQIIKKEKPKRLYNYYDYGGYLIYRDIFVFIDGRADLYSKYNYQDYYNLSLLRGPYDRILEKYEFDYFLLNKGYPLAYYLSINGDYELLLEKENTVLYKKR